MNGDGRGFRLRSSKRNGTCTRTDGTPKAPGDGRDAKSFRRADSAVYNRGEVDKPGAESCRAACCKSSTTKTPKISRGSGRLELANWVASADNPLTARVYVNRVWLHLFGRGLVATPDNFGTTGQPAEQPGAARPPGGLVRRERTGVRSN